MGHEQLLNTLKTLHAQLSSMDEIDAESQAMLQTVTDDIHRILELKSAPKQDAAEDADPSFSVRIRDTLIELESRHPRVGDVLERLTDGLASMGI